MTNYLKSQIILILHGLFSGVIFWRDVWQGEYLFAAIPLILGVCIVVAMRYTRRDVIDLVESIARGRHNEK